MSLPPPPRRDDWTLDPRERARFLDGEGTPQELAARRGDLDRDPSARARVERDAAFLAAVRAGRAALEPVPAGLEARVRAALAADREGTLAPRPLAPVHAFPGRARALGFAAAAAAAALALWLTVAGAPRSEASDGASIAAEAVRRARTGRLPGPPGATCEEGATSPYRFPLVAAGELSITGCGPTADAAGAVAVLQSGEDPSSSRGLVTMPTRSAAATGRAPDVGILTLDDMVVFDVALGGVRYYLAAPRESVERLGNCAACHSSSRDGLENPHRFTVRTK